MSAFPRKPTARTSRSSHQDEVLPQRGEWADGNSAVLKSHGTDRYRGALCTLQQILKRAAGVSS
jgi:hypothetical protein